MGGNKAKLKRGWLFGSHGPAKAVETFYQGLGKGRAGDCSGHWFRGRLGNVQYAADFCFEDFFVENNAEDVICPSHQHSQFVFRGHSYGQNWHLATGFNAADGADSFLDGIAIGFWEGTLKQMFRSHHYEVMVFAGTASSKIIHTPCVKAFDYGLIVAHIPDCDFDEVVEPPVGIGQQHIKSLHDCL